MRPVSLRRSQAKFEGLHGVFADSLPDGWGRLLLDRDLLKRGIARQYVTPLHRLAHVGAHGMGALVYRPELERETPNEDELNLTELQTHATQILEGEESELLSSLVSLGGSSGGARPKVLVGFRRKDSHVIHGALDDKDHVPYIVKFRNTEDPKDTGQIEWAYSEMARAAGLEIPETRLFVGKRRERFFGVRRFDRTAAGARVHVHSFGGLLHIDHRIPGAIDYTDLLKATRALTKDQREVENAFRHMVFNGLAHNRDDHVKNFAFVMNDAGEWKKSPAFDLTLSVGPGGEHWMAVAGEGRNPTEKHFLAAGAAAGVKKGAAQEIVEQVRTATKKWPKFAEKAELSKAAAERVRSLLG